jgi:hypothetical protein
LPSAVIAVLITASEAFAEVVAVVVHANVVTAISESRVLVSERIVVIEAPAILTIRLTRLDTFLITRPHGLPELIRCILIRIVVSPAAIVAVNRRSVLVAPTLKPRLVCAHVFPISLLIAQLRYSPLALEAQSSLLLDSLLLTLALAILIQALLLNCLFLSLTLDSHLRLLPLLSLLLLGLLSLRLLALLFPLSLLQLLLLSLLLLLLNLRLLSLRLPLLSSGALLLLLLLLSLLLLSLGLLSFLLPASFLLLLLLRLNLLLLSLRLLLPLLSPGSLVLLLSLLLLLLLSLLLLFPLRLLLLVRILRVYKTATCKQERSANNKSHAFLNQ